MAPSVVIVGGGVMGAAAAWRLAGRGHRVTVLERFGPGHDRGSSHGSSRIFRLTYADPWYVGLALRALPLWRRLEEESGQRVLTVTGAVDHGAPGAVEELAGALAEAGRPGLVLSPAEAAERWPGLRADTSVLHHAEGGRLHADAAVAALLAAAAGLGADVRHGVRVRALRRTGSGVTVETEEGGRVLADAAVVAVGGWSPSVLPDLVDGLPPLRVTQEQPLHFAVEDALEWPAFVHHPGAEFHEPGGVYGLGSPDGVKVGFHAVGPVVDPDHRDRTPDPVAAERLEAYVRAWLPGLARAAPEPVTCLYTSTPDHDFVVDRQGPVTVLAGFSGHGFKFAPAIGELAADLVEGRPGARRFALGRPLPAAVG
ncbi:FAD-dependent oxidoreductase [Streptomyces sp. NBC_00102]|uniref:FAD-dependent oxidoreductase n=1 Tax=Streptomyces sp. NBC_00102 TaxID=2975652 RepID=UPI0022568B7B|nr:FAD-dependent oxidoreductase [Streptomyces sp. NBC_00102]MCX5401809.1 FAD-dependent oxidoreductase [Streptomyces sp. NBC_00102]